MKTLNSKLNEVVRDLTALAERHPSLLDKFYLAPVWIDPSQGQLLHNCPSRAQPFNPRSM